MELRESHAFETQAWRNKAACAGYPTHWWFPDKGHGKDLGIAARAVCQRCPVIDDCLNHALSRVEEGIWANTNTKERSKLRNTGRYYKHLICQECRNMFLRSASDSAGMRPYCSRVCQRKAGNRRSSE